MAAPEDGSDEDRSDEDRTDEERTDEELVAAHQAGDPAALPALIRRHGADVRAHARAIVVDLDEADDVAQEVFLSLARNLGRWRAETRFGLWLGKVTKNTAITALRRRRRAAVPVAPSDLVSLRSSGDAFGTVDDRLFLAELLSELDPDQRAAVTLYDLAGLPYAEIAQSLHCPETTARTRVHRGRGHLRNIASQRLLA